MMGLRAARQALQRSLPLKVLAVLVLAGAAMNVLLIQGYRLAREAELRHSGTSLAQEYARELTHDLGDPPDERKARAVALAGIWSLRYEPDPPGSTGGWTTDPALLSVAQARQILKGKTWGREGHLFRTLVPYAHGTLFMVAKPYGELRLGWQWLLALFTSLFSVLTLIWLALRWLLKPVDWLNEGMDRVAQGELDYRVPTRETDELGRLAQQFNSMTGQIQAMLDQRRQLLLDVSHELRTPITRLKLGLESLPEGEERLSLAEDVESLELLVAELLEGARLAHGRSQLHMEPLDLVHLVRDGAQEFQGQGAGVELTVPDTLPCQGDPLRLQRLFLNLLKNALVHGQPARGPVQVSLIRQGQQAVLSVEDRGPGLAKEHLERLFVPFFRSDASRARSTGGVGLGLHLCRRVAQAHGGDLVAALGPQGGLIFTLTLPVA